MGEGQGTTVTVTVTFDARMSPHECKARACGTVGEVWTVEAAQLRVKEVDTHQALA